MQKKLKKLQIPDWYNYPPFWTIQSEKDVQKKQVELWHSWILHFMKTMEKMEMEISGIVDSMIFKNDKIGRSLPKKDVVFLLDLLVKKGNAKWKNDEKAHIRIYWKPLEEWANRFVSWANESGNRNKGPFTFHELREDHGFDDMSLELMKEAAIYLENQTKAKLYDSNSLDECGIKIF